MQPSSLGQGLQIYKKKFSFKAKRKRAGVMPPRGVGVYYKLQMYIVILIEKTTPEYGTLLTIAKDPGSASMADPDQYPFQPNGKIT